MLTERHKECIRESDGQAFHFALQGSAINTVCLPTRDMHVSIKISQQATICNALYSKSSQTVQKSKFTACHAAYRK